MRLAALAVLVAAGVLWGATGAHPGWSRTEITEMKHDEITGIDYPVQRPGFVAGVDFLALAGGVAVILFGASFLLGRKPALAQP